MPDLFESGVFGNNEPAWHKQGIVVAGALNTEDALRLGGIDWQVEKRPLFVAAGGGYTQVEGHSAIVRTKDTATLGVVGSRYQPIQNAEAFGFVDFLLQDKEAQWETAISVDGGRTVAGLLSLAQTGIEIRKGDKHYRFLTIITTHDGSGSAKAFPTDVRVVCANTVAAALGGRNRGLTVNVRHSGDIKGKASDAARVLARASADFDRFDAWQQQLVEAPMSQDNFKAVMELLLPQPANDATARSMSMWSNKVALLSGAVKQEVLLLPQFTGGQARPTAYELFNGITRYIDHSVADRKSDRFEYAMLTGGADFKAAGIDAINKVFDIKVAA